MSSQLAVDLAARTSGQARHYADRIMGIHLRQEHGWGRRRVAKYLDRSEKWVKEYCEQVI